MDDIRAKPVNKQKFALRLTSRTKNSFCSKYNRARALKRSNIEKWPVLGWPYCHMIFNEGNLQFEFGHLRKNVFDKLIKYMLIKYVPMKKTSGKQTLLRGLATVNFYAADVKAAKKWYSELLGIEPYFERPDSEHPAYI
jgi:hypothetical protein